MYKKFVSFLKIYPLRFVFIVFAILVAKEIIFINTFRDKVSPIADGFSEANAIRGALFFMDKGIGYFQGLPDIGYSDFLSGKGVRGYPNFGYKEEAYTHYPPGPEYLIWLGFKVLGRGNFNHLRYLPITFSILVGIFFINTIFSAVGGGTKGLILSLGLILPPMYSNYMHGLHYQQYAFLLLQLQICVAIRFVNQSQLWHSFAFLILGFLQGWLSFDYAFLASLFFIPFVILFNRSLGDFVRVCFMSGIGFSISHLIHFQQVVSYFGSFDRAINEFIHSAAHRSFNAGTAKDPSNPKFSDIGLFTVAKDFLYRVAGRGKYLAINLINFIWIILSLRFIKTIETKKYRFHFDVATRDILALASAVIISSMWSIVMRQHAHIHGFIARHYYFCYFFCCLILVMRTSVLKKNEPLPVT